MDDIIRVSIIVHFFIMIVYMALEIICNFFSPKNNIPMSVEPPKSNELKNDISSEYSHMECQSSIRKPIYKYSLLVYEQNIMMKNKIYAIQKRNLDKLNLPTCLKQLDSTLVKSFALDPPPYACVIKNLSNVVPYNESIELHDINFTLVDDDPILFEMSSFPEFLDDPPPFYDEDINNDKSNSIPTNKNSNT